MDPQDSAQDIIRCELCETPVSPIFCDICHIQLCLHCVGIHISDRSKKHEVVPFEERGSTTKCPKHSTKISELYCEECNVPICSQCISSGKHLGHKALEIMKIFTSKKEVIKEDLQEIEIFIYPKYQEAVSNIPVQKANAKKPHPEINNGIKETRRNLTQRNRRYYKKNAIRN